MKYYVIAGEASGDLHGSNLLRALLAADSDANIRFWGGDLMNEVAVSAKPGSVEMVRHIRDLAFMGFVEVVSHLSLIIGNIRFCKRDILSYNPDVVVFIDYPGFNLKIAKYTHAHGFRNVFYISPQIWAWKKGRIHPMRRDLDRLCYILPTERKFYSENTFPQALFVGHPLLDAVSRYKSHTLDFNDERKVIALLPGSRKQELRRMLPIMTELTDRHPEYLFCIAGMNLIGEEFYKQYIKTDKSNIRIVYDRTYDLLASSYAAVVCSGTATLETSLFRVPQVVCYRCNRISAAIARRLVASRIKYISLVNLIADCGVVAELIQNDCNLERLEKEFARITSDSDVRNGMMTSYDEVISMLGGVGASDRTAKEIISIASKK